MPDATRRIKMGALARSNSFGGLPDAALAPLASAMTQVSVKRGDLAFRQGEPATGLYILVSGQLKLCIETPGGDEHVLEILGEGECFGEAAVLTDRMHLFTAAAVTECTLLHMPRNILMVQLDANSALAQRLLRHLGDRLYQRTNEVEHSHFRRAGVRVAKFLLDQLERQGNAAGGRITLPSRKGLIASSLNMTQEHFSRTLRAMSAGGNIRVSGSEISVIDVQGLRGLTQ